MVVLTCQMNDVESICTAEISGVNVCLFVVFFSGIGVGDQTFDIEIVYTYFMSIELCSLLKNVV